MIAVGPSLPPTTAATHSSLGHPALTWNDFRHYLWFYWTLADSRLQKQPKADTARKKIRALVTAIIPEREPESGERIGFSPSRRGLWLRPNQDELLSPNPTLSTKSGPSQVARRFNIKALRFDFRHGGPRGIPSRLEAFVDSHPYTIWRTRDQGLLAASDIQDSPVFAARLLKEVNLGLSVPPSGMRFLGPLFAGQDSAERPLCWIALGTFARLTAIKPPFIAARPKSPIRSPEADAAADAALWAVQIQNSVAYDVLRVVEAYFSQGVSPVTVSLVLEPLQNWKQYDRDQVFIALTWLRSQGWLRVDREISDEKGIVRRVESDALSRIVRTGPHFSAVSYHLMSGYPTGWFLDDLAGWASDSRCTLPLDVSRQLIRVPWFHYDEDDVPTQRRLAQLYLGLLKRALPGSRSSASLTDSDDDLDAFLASVFQLISKRDSVATAELLDEFARLVPDTSSLVCAMRAVAALQGGSGAVIQERLAELAASCADPRRRPRTLRQSSLVAGIRFWLTHVALDDLLAALAKVLPSIPASHFLPLVEFIGGQGVVYGKHIRKALSPRNDVPSEDHKRILGLITPPPVAPS